MPLRESIDVRNCGCTRLRDLIEDIPNFATEQRDNDQVWVKRLR